MGHKQEIFRFSGNIPSERDLLNNTATDGDISFSTTLTNFTGIVPDLLFFIFFMHELILHEQFFFELEDSPAEVNAEFIHNL